MESKATVFTHIKELRYRVTVSAVWVLIGFIASLYFYNDIVEMLSKPYQGFKGFKEFYITSLFEGFFTKIKLCFTFGMVAAAPIILYQCLRFIFPGLKPKEKKLISISLVMSVILASLAFYFGYFIFMPFSIKFLMSKAYLPPNVDVLLNFNTNIFYVVNFIVYALLVFQLPILLECLLYLNLVSRKALMRSSRYVVVGIFILSAVVTPPDIVSQIGISVPLITLYFLTILIARIFRFGE